MSFLSSLSANQKPTRHTFTDADNSAGLPEGRGVAKEGSSVRTEGESLGLVGNGVTHRVRAIECAAEAMGPR